MIRPDLDYRQLKEGILRTAPHVFEPDAYTSDGEEFLYKDHQLILAIKLVMILRDRVSEAIPGILGSAPFKLLMKRTAAQSRIYTAQDSKLAPDPNDELFVDWFSVEEAEKVLFSQHITGPALFRGKMHETYSPEMVELLGYRGVGAGVVSNVDSENIIYELCSNAVAHGSNYGEKGPVKVEWFGRRNEVLVGFTQPSRFDLRDMLENARTRSQRPETSSATEFNYVNTSGRLRGNGFSNFVSSPYSINATYCPDQDCTTTFMHVTV